MAVEPAHLPHYSHSAVIVGAVIIVVIIALLALGTIAVLYFRRGR